MAGKSSMQSGDENMNALLIGLLIGLLIAHFFLTTTPKYADDPRIDEIMEDSDKESEAEGEYYYEEEEEESEDDKEEEKEKSGVQDGVRRRNI
ncbi:unnamed protein product [Moneuplotes crassus]|uniref:Uncharacterized protein n=1 Tax=Euplotes crassus TaxID=5936 RepID=A0AAD1Y2I6_EUPCR|nr:unnamed protein product [Moneuplotes crassus]